MTQAINKALCKLMNMFLSQGTYSTLLLLFGFPQTKILLSCYGEQCGNILGLCEGPSVSSLR